MPTDQITTWTGDFGRDYTDRNPQSVAELDSLYSALFGLTRTGLNDAFLADVPRAAPILEIGCNAGVQLMALAQMGFSQLRAVEIQTYAIACARSRFPAARYAQASAFELPFGDGAFDLTYTSGVLIHLSPDDLPRALDEIHRCSSRYIWGWEYYADTPTEIPYRGHTALMWKAPFARLFLERFNDLALVRETRVKYLASNNYDHMYLLEKTR